MAEVVPQSLHEAFESLEFRFLLHLPKSELQTAERLFFHIEQAHWFYEDFLADHHKHLRHFHKLDDFARAMFERCELLQPMQGEFDALYDQFRFYRARIPVYGAILLNESLTRVLLVQGYNSKSWSFPKGKVNEDEDGIVCAARELYEEIGFDCGSMLREDDFVETMSKQGKRIRLYLASGAPEDFDYAPRVRKEIKAVRFFDVKDLPTSYQNSSNKFWGLQNFTPQLLKWIQRRRRGSAATPVKQRANKNNNQQKQQQQQQQKQQQKPQQQQQQQVTIMSKKKKKAGDAAPGALSLSIGAFTIDFDMVNAAMQPFL